MASVSCCRGVSALFLYLSLVALWPPVAEAQLQLSNFNMTRAVEILAERFGELASDGLGVDALKESYQRASYSYSTLSLNYIEQLLSNSSFPESINEVLTLFENIVGETAPGVPTAPLDCCSSAGSTAACCYSCRSSPALSDVSRVAGAYASSNLLDGTTLLFASPSGAFLSQPSPSSVNCSREVKDGRLEPWFTNVTRENPLEVVVVLDLFRRGVIREEVYREMINGVTTVLRSLNNEDRFSVVGVDSSPVIPRASIFSQTETIPICPEALIEMESFATSFEPRPPPGVVIDHGAAFETAFNLFSGNDTEKLILFFTSGLQVFTTSGELSLTNNIARLKSLSNDSVTISAFRIFRAGPIDDMNFQNITAPNGVVIDLSENGQSLVGPVSSLVGGYFAIDDSSLTPTSDVIFSHARSSAGESLSLTRPYFNGSTLVGVFRALIPWQHLLSHIFSVLEDRPSSYSFVTDSSGRVLYHPLIPSDGDDRVVITDLETDGMITEVLSLLDSSMYQMRPVVKQLLRHTGSRDENAFFLHTSPSEYYCQRVRLNNDDYLNLCLVLAEADMTLANLDPINPSTVYEAGTSPPVYHNLEYVDSSKEFCNYFCKRSLRDQLSFQLTGPTTPVDTSSFAEEVTNFVTGRSTTPPEGVGLLAATEIGLASRSLASKWMDSSSAPSGYIARRHLATSSGVYLSFPAVHLNRSFIPSRTEWYQSSVARGNLLTLTPPRTDSLSEAGQFTISAAYTVRAPQQRSGQSGRTRPLAVVAADMTLSSVRSFLREAAPACEEDPSANCLIVDDMLHIIYDTDTFNTTGLESGTRFLGRPIGNTEFLRYQGVLFDLVRGNSSTSEFVSKRECVDYYSTDIETRRFYQLDTSYDSLIANVSDRTYCVDYMLQHIRGTNSFLLVVKEKSNCRGRIFCGCSLEMECTNCLQFNDRFCECPCVCSDDCRRDIRPEVVPACPAINTTDNLAVADSSSLADSDTLLEPPFCFNQECNCRESLDSCLSSRECSWCEAEGKCVHITDCCTRDESGVCCGLSPQLERFRNYGSCRNMFTNVCRQEPGAFDVTCPFVTPNQTSLIVAVVVGVIFGILLIAFLVIFIVWYQFFRKPDVAEETSRESAFDFSKKRMESTNPMANSAPDVKSDDGCDVGIVKATSKSPTSPHPPTEEPEKVALDEISNGNKASKP